MNIYINTISRIALGVVLSGAIFGFAHADDDNNKDNTEKKDLLVVTGNSREELRDILSPGVVSVVYPDDVKGEHKSLPDLLDQIPGVYVRRVGGTGGYTTTSIRGSAPSQVNIYIDGVPYNTSSEVAADISTIPISNVERVEVYRGTVPARFSGAPLGGAINIVTKNPTGISGNLSSGFRSFNGWQAAGNVNFPLFGGGMLIGVDAEHSDGDFKYPFIAQRELNAIEYGDAAYTADGTATAPYRSYTTLGGWIIDPKSQLPDERRRKNSASSRANLLVKWKNDNWTAKYSFNYMHRYLPAYAEGVYSIVDTDEAVYPLSTWQGTTYNQRRHQYLYQHEAALGWRKSLEQWKFAVNMNYTSQDKKFKNPDYIIASGIGTKWAEYNTERYGMTANASYEFGRD